MESIKQILTANLQDQTSSFQLKRITYQLDDIEKGLKVFKAIALNLCPVFVASKEFVRVAEILIKYAHNIEQPNIDNCKALGIYGATGVRKTFIMNCLHHYMKIDNVRYFKDGKERNFNFQTHVSRDIVSHIVLDGKVEDYLSINVLNIDDLGVETKKIMHFGNEINPIEAILEARHRKGRLTHFTTNLSPESIKLNYGERCLSRIIEATNLIQMSDIDFRVMNFNNV